MTSILFAKQLKMAATIRLGGNCKIIQKDQNTEIA